MSWRRWRLCRDSDKNWFESRVTEVNVDEDPQKIKVRPKPIEDGRQGGGREGSEGTL